MNITLYTKTQCPLCDSAKKLLTSKGLTYGEASVEKPGTLEALQMLHPAVRQMPAIFIDGQYVGGFEGLKAALEQAGV